MSVNFKPPRIYAIIDYFGIIFGTTAIKNSVRLARFKC